jgi:RES domain-containing protein
MALPPEPALVAIRIADKRHPLCDGKGAMLIGGRWNSPGARIIYCAMNHACAMLERLAHANTLRLPRSLIWAEIIIPQGVSIEEVDPERVPGWDRARSRSARAFGDGWYRSQRSAVLIVPSVVSRPDKNVLINQDHRQFREIHCGDPRPVIWDRRILDSVKSVRAR